MALISKFAATFVADAKSRLCERACSQSDLAMCVLRKEDVFGAI